MATKKSAPQRKSGSSNNSQSYSPASRGELNSSDVTVKGQPSGGGLQGISSKCDPEEGSTGS